jgi:hypothetical protein
VQDHPGDVAPGGRGAQEPERLLERGAFERRVRFGDLVAEHRPGPPAFDPGERPDGPEQVGQPRQREEQQREHGHERQREQAEHRGQRGAQAEHQVDRGGAAAFQGFFHVHQNGKALQACGAV